MANKQIVKCQYSVSFSEVAETTVGIDVAVPTTAGLPFVLTSLCAEVAETVPNLRIQQNIPHIFAWSYYNAVLRDNGLDNVEALAEKIQRIIEAKDESALVMAQKLLGFLSPSGEVCDALADLSERHQHMVLFAACVYHSLLTNKEITSDSPNCIDYMELMTGLTSVNINCQLMLKSSLAMIDLILESDEVACDHC